MGKNTMQFYRASVVTQKLKYTVSHKMCLFIVDYNSYGFFTIQFNPIYFNSRLVYTEK